MDNHRELIYKKVGEEFEVKYILDIRDFPDDKYQDKIVKDFNIIVEDSEVDIVAEVIGGATFAYEFTKRALEAGKYVVTSNKELVSKKGPELLKIAPTMPKDKAVIVNMSGRGDKDIFITAPVFNKQEWVEFLSNEIKN